MPYYRALHGKMPIVFVTFASLLTLGIQGIQPNCVSQYGSHSKFISTKVLFSNVVCQGRYMEKPYVTTQVDAVKDTIVTGYNKELKVTLQLS